MAAAKLAIIAPAGYGKTQEIVGQFAAAGGRTLILTHTNAGVSALFSRLVAAGVPRCDYELATIASYFKRWVEAYPIASGYEACGLEGPTVGKDYERVYSCAARVLAKDWAQRVVAASYQRVIVDEYQDCTLGQRAALFALADELPLTVYGDPMQSVFYWAGELADIEDSAFVVVTMVSEPHRWINAGNPELGFEIARIRQELLPTLAGGSVTVQLDDGVPGITLVRPNEGQGAIYGCLSKYGQQCSILYLTGHENGQLAFCKRNMGFQVNETIECSQLFEWAERFDEASGSLLSLRALEFAEACLTHVSTELGSYKSRLEKGDVNFSRIKKHAAIAPLLTRVADSGSCSDVLCVLDWLERSSAGFRLFRGQLYGEMKRALRYAQANRCDLMTAAAKTHGDMESYEKRYGYRRLASRVILSKGLEYDVAIVDARTIKDPRDFYVAISRCRRGLVVIADSETLSFGGVAK